MADMDVCDGIVYGMPIAAQEGASWQLGLACDVRSPVRHESAALLEQVGPPVRGFDPVVVDVRQCEFADLIEFALVAGRDGDAVVWYLLDLVQVPPQRGDGHLLVPLLRLEQNDRSDAIRIIRRGLGLASIPSDPTDPARARPSPSFGPSQTRVRAQPPFPKEATLSGRRNAFPLARINHRFLNECQC